MANYVTNVPVASSTTVCPAPKEYYDDADLMKPFTKGVASDAFVPDATTGRIAIAQIQSHVNALESAGVIKARPAKPVGASDMETVMDALVADDTELYNRLHDEYCYYEQRYKYALKRFLSKATSRVQGDNAEAQAMLRNTKLLNIRVNSVLEVMNYLAAIRVSIVNMNKEDINKRNKTINEKLERLQAGYKILSRDNVIINTQKEMVRYTEEKNNYNSNQIAVWAAMNIVALGVIFYVYRN